MVRETLRDGDAFRTLRLRRHNAFVANLFRERPGLERVVSRCDVKMVLELLLHRLGFVAAQLVRTLLGCQGNHKGALAQALLDRFLLQRRNRTPCLLGMHLARDGRAFLAPQRKFAEKLAHIYPYAKRTPLCVAGQRPLCYTAPCLSPEPCRADADSARTAPFVLDYYAARGDERSWPGAWYSSAFRSAKCANAAGNCAEDYAAVASIRWGREPVRCPVLPLTFCVKVDYTIGRVQDPSSMAVQGVSSIIQCEKCHCVRLARNSVTDWLGDAKNTGAPAEDLAVHCDYATAALIDDDDGGGGGSELGREFRRVREALLAALVDDAGAAAQLRIALTHRATRDFPSLEQVCPACYQTSQIAP